MRRVLFAVCMMSLPAVVDAATNYYQYDTMGRVSATCQWQPSSGKRVEYSFDKASNRTKYRSFDTPVTIASNSGLDSSGGRYHFVMQGDGNLVLYDGGSAGGSNWTPIWSSQTGGSGGSTANMQSDGNFVIRKQDGTAVWSTNTYGKWCAALYVQPDGKVVIYDLAGKAIWSTS